MGQKIYTKRGDQGETGLVGGQRMSKSDMRIELYGTVDELNSFLGRLVSVLGVTSPSPSWPKEWNHQAKFLQTIQSQLFDLGSQLACLKEDREKFSLPTLGESDVKQLEEQIDRMQSYLKPLNSFILPGGSEAASSAHVCRTICRRLERLLVNYDKQNPNDLPDVSIIFLNRLSDYLFVSARFFNFCLGVNDVPWEPRKS